jgi:hypothetical protein
MPRVEATHWICGTTVSADVPDDYDLEEGVALACPNCQDVWWHYPLAVGVAGDTGVDATIAGRRLGPGHESRAPQATRLVTNWLGPALVLCLIAIVLLRLADPGPRSTAAPPRSLPAGDQSAARLTNIPYTRVIAGQYTIDRPARWVRFARNNAQVLAPARDAPLTVSIFVERRPDVSATQLAGLSGQLLAQQLSGARITGPRPYRLPGPDGELVVARRGGFLREMLVVAGGPYRYVVQVAARPSAGRADLVQLSRMLPSFHATP